MEDEKIKDGTFKIRPAGRHIITIGKDLIKDKYAAIVELVKNAYDADSPTCKVSLLPFETDGKRGIKVTIKDEGHGMSYETVVNKWMVPSTDDKYHRESSPKGRLMQGKKGIGRYSASIIGDDLLLETIDDHGELTYLYLVWADFEKAEYLEDVNILIENYKTKKKPGTEITIIGDETHLEEWDWKQIQNLKFELKKLVPPIDTSIHKIKADTNFKIELELGQFQYEGISNTTEKIEPYPLFELYDYRISGIVNKEGMATLKFENNRIEDVSEEIPPFKIILNKSTDQKNEQSYCGEVQLDFRVYDRDPDSIDGLIQRGLRDPSTGSYVGKREARIILDIFNGIGVYRNGFRIRPLGDAGYDWVELDKRRVQNPSLRIGSDQVIGFIHIESENASGLQEKSARDGIRETAQYFGLQEICLQVLTKLEEKRFGYRQSAGLGRRSIEKPKIEYLSSLQDLREKIDKELDDLGVTNQKKKEIEKIISDKEKENTKIVEELQESIALYQGQATIGKIVNVILHEGRKPLSYFRNQIPVISEWIEELEVEYDSKTMNKVTSRLANMNKHSDILIGLFDKLDPLSAKKRLPKQYFQLLPVIENIHDVFSSQIKNQDIQFIVECDKDLTCYGWQDDFYIAFTNLVDNSIHWLNDVENRKKEIHFNVYIEEKKLVIDYFDNGPGIEKHLIESQVIFDPEFTRKDGGMGLGLAISGEAMHRNSGELKAIYSEKGAFFKIEINKSL